MFLPVLEAVKSKVKRLAGSVSGEGRVLGHRWPSSGWQKGLGNSPESLCKGTNLVHKGFILIASPLPKTPPPDTVTLGLRVST